MSRLVPAILLLVACGSDYSAEIPDKENPPADPPGRDPNAIWGDPPVWGSAQDVACFQGHRGMYFNLEANHPDVEPDELLAVGDVDDVDWWDLDRITQDQFDASIDFGADWWPVNEGIEADPAYFAVRWVAWIRVWRDLDLEFSLGGANDAFVVFNDDVVLAAESGLPTYDPQVFRQRVESGQFHLDVRYAHRAGEQSGFRFRVLNDADDVTICYPDYTKNKEAGESLVDD